MIRENLRADFLDVCCRQQAFDRILDEGGVAQIRVAVLVGETHGLSHGVHRRGRVKAQGFHWIAGQDLQHFAQGHAAGARRRG